MLSKDRKKYDKPYMPRQKKKNKKKWGKDVKKARKSVSLGL